MNLNMEFNREDRNEERLNRSDQQELDHEMPNHEERQELYYDGGAEQHTTDETVENPVHSEAAEPDKKELGSEQTDSSFLQNTAPVENNTRGAAVQKKRKGRGLVLAITAGVLVGAIAVNIPVPIGGGQTVSEMIDSLKGDDASSQYVQTVASNANVQSVSVDVNTDVTKAVEKTMDAVVGVVNKQQSFFSQGAAQEAGSGSGVIYKKADGKAYVVTNNHVVEGASSVDVKLSDGTVIEAKLLGADALMDLAVLEIDGAKVTKVAEFGNSDALKPGEPVIAIGNPLGFLEGTVTQGIVSTAERSMPIDLNNDGVDDWQAEVIQTDASINPGNSGGALINVAGQLVGINSMKIATSGVEGIGFAIPINVALPIMEQLEKNGEVNRPYIGIAMRSLTEVPQSEWQRSLGLPESVTGGVVIAEVSPNSPASKAGLERLDVITAINGENVKDMLAFRKYLYSKTKIGEQIKLEIYRDGKKQSIKVTLQDTSMGMQ